MKKVLFIAFEFPPMQSAGVNRSLRFVKYLPRYGIQPIVVTVSPEDAETIYKYRIDCSLLSQVPNEALRYNITYVSEQSKLHKARSYIAKILFEKDDMFDRMEESFENILCQVKNKYEVDAVYLTMPPFFMYQAALIAKSKLSVPLIVDMRDAWSQWGSNPFRSFWHYSLIVKRERRILQAANAVVCVTPQLANMEIGIYKSARDKIHVIPNAYEEFDEERDSVCLEPGKNVYKIGYIGSFYYDPIYENEDGVVPWYKKPVHRWLHYYATKQRWIYRTPFYFFRALSELRKGFPNKKNTYEFHYAGNAPSWLLVMAKLWNVDDCCCWHGWLSKHEAKRFIDSMDIMLSTSIKVEGGEDYCLASKSFDYISANKPVLGYVSPGSQREFILKSGSGVVCDPDNVDECVKTLLQLANDGVKRKYNSEYLKNYSADSTTSKLANIIYNLTGNEDNDMEAV